MPVFSEADVFLSRNGVDELVRMEDSEDRVKKAYWLLCIPHPQLVGRDSILERWLQACGSSQSSTRAALSFCDEVLSSSLASRYS